MQLILVETKMKVFLQLCTVDKNLAAEFSTPDYGI